MQTFFGQKGKGFFRCGSPQFSVQKTSEFSKFIVCPHGLGDGVEGLSQCGHFSDKRGWGSIVLYVQYCAAKMI